MTDVQTSLLKFEFARALEELGADESMLNAAIEKGLDVFKEIFSIKIQQLVLDHIHLDRSLHYFYMQNPGLVNEIINNSTEIFLEIYAKKSREN